MAGARRPAPSRPKAGGTARGVDRRRSELRRKRVILAGGIILSLVILAAWFPLGTLVSQHRSLGAMSAQLTDLKAQDRALAEERAKLNSPAEILKLAREQYQLVQPGQRVVQVLPPSGAPSSGNAGQAPYPGDPGLAKPVAPSAVALLPSGTTTTLPPQPAPVKAGTTTSHAASAGRGLWQRVIGTLSFWRG